MKVLKRTGQLSLSFILVGVALLLLAGSLWAQDFFSLTRITTGESGRRSFAPSMNNDGSKIAFVSDADLLNQGNIDEEQYEIWLYDTETLAFTRITTGTSDRDSFDPSISSDGSKITFYSDADFLNQGIPDNRHEIWLYDTDTLTFTRITTGGWNRSSYSPNINSDGSKIAFESNADLLDQGNIGYSQYEIWLYDTNTLTLTRITTGTNYGDNRDASISSDGSKIAFQSDTDFFGQGIPNEHDEIWLYDADTLTVTRITTGESDRDSYRPSISSDGSKIAFYGDADLLGQGIPDGQYEIWLYDVNTLTLTRITTGQSDRSSGHPHINSDGSKIVFESDADFLGQGHIDQYQYEIWLYDVNTQGLTRITTGESERQSFAYAINDDGSKIIFDSDVDFFAQGTVERFQTEIWMAGVVTPAQIYLPLVLKF